LHLKSGQVWWAKNRWMKLIAYQFLRT
jgi:hypothetical protein